VGEGKRDPPGVVIISITFARGAELMEREKNFFFLNNPGTKQEEKKASVVECERKG